MSVEPQFWSKERVDLNTLTFPEVSLPLSIRKELLVQLYLFHEIDVKQFAENLSVDEDDVKKYIQLLIQSLVLRGYYKGQKFAVSTFYKYPSIYARGLNNEQKALLGFLSVNVKTTLTFLSNLFHVTKTHIVNELKILVSNGLFIGMVKKDVIKIEWIYPAKSPQKSKISEKEKVIIGLCMMLRIANLEKVSKLLSIPRKEVVITIGKLLFYGYLETEITQKTKIFGGAKTYVNIKRFLIKPRKMELLALTGVERDAVGFLLLCKRTTINNLSKLMGVPEEEVIKTLALLTSEGTFQSFFVTTNEVEPVIIPELKPKQTIEELAALSFFNYEALIGILSTTDKIPLKKLALELNRDVGEVLDALERLVLEGFLDATLYGSTLYISHIYRLSRTHEGTLERWEKIVLGMLIAKPYITVKDLSKAFNIGKLSAREKLFSFYGKGLIKGRIEKNKLIPEEVPIFPLLNQLEDFPIHYQEIFGFLTSQGSVKIKVLQNIWQKSEIAIKNAVYEMTGAGLMVVEEHGKRFVTVSFQKFFPQKEIRELGRDYIRIINTLEKRKKKKVKISAISETTGIPKLTVFKILCQLLANGYYQGILSPKTFIITVGLRLPAKKLHCIYCGHVLTNPDKPCSNCGKLAPKCSVCHGMLKIGDEVLECPNCGNVAHKDHMLQWLSIKSECPVCKTILSKDSLTVKRL